MSEWGGGAGRPDDPSEGSSRDPWAPPPPPGSANRPPAGEGPFTPPPPVAPTPGSWQQPPADQPRFDPASGFPSPGQYPPPGYDPQAAAYGYPPVRNSGKAIAILVLGISSLVTCWVGFIPAIIALAMSPSARREISWSGGRIQGNGMVTAGVVMSWVTIGLTVLFWAAVVIGAAADSGDSSGY